METSGCSRLDSDMLDFPNDARILPSGSEAGAPASIAALSADLLVLVLERVSRTQDRKSARATCRAFFDAEALQRRALRVLRREPLLQLLRRYGSLESLDLSVCPSLDDVFLSTVVNAVAPLPLRNVCLARASGVGWRGLEALVAACPRLEVVDLSHCVSVSDREAAAVAMAAALKELRIDKCLTITDFGLAKVAVGCPRLERLSMKWCREISDIGIELLAKKCLELTALDISYLTVSNESLMSISTLEKLVDLSIVGCSFIDDHGLMFLGEGSCSLQRLDVSRCDHLTSDALAYVMEGNEFLQEIRGCDCLHELVPYFPSSLSLSKNTLNTLKLDSAPLSVPVLSAIGVSCKNLIEIGLSKCTGVTDEGIAALVANCCGLTTIDITCCHLLSDTALASIAVSCKKVECLLLESCCLISDKGLDYIATSCGNNLKEIDLTDCNITDAALLSLCKCLGLLTLKLGLCSNIRNEGLIQISSHCKELVELDLYRCSAITDDGLAALACGCKKLRKLNLCYCSAITDNGLSYLSCLQELSDLELRGLLHLTSVGITSLAKGCKSLVELDLKRCYAIDDAAMWALATYCENLRQITISYCQVTGLGLCHLLGTLKCLQDVKLVHLSWVSTEGFEIALRAACGRLKKVKLLMQLKELLTPELLQLLHASGCRIRWLNKPLTF